MTDLPPVERLQVVEIRPGDTILASVSAWTPMDQVQALKRQLAERWPDNEISILAGGIKLAVYRPGDDLETA